MNKLRCQSCGMPLGFPLPEHFFGSNSDDSVNKEYCSFCFQKGAFTNPSLTVEEMIQSSIQHMTSQLEFPQEKAHTLAHEIIPQLKRWRN